MTSINFHDLCQRVAQKEGGAVNLSIAQISEVVSLTLKELATHKPEDVFHLLVAYAPSKEGGTDG